MHSVSANQSADIFTPKSASYQALIKKQKLEWCRWGKRFQYTPIQDTNVNRFTSDIEEKAYQVYWARLGVGVRVASFEMYTAELLSNVFTCLIDVFWINPSTLELNGVVYDRSCDLRPFILKLAANGNTIARNWTRKNYQEMADQTNALDYDQNKDNNGAASLQMQQASWKWTRQKMKMKVRK